MQLIPLVYWVPNKPYKGVVFLMTDMEFHIDNFMLYCSSKNLSLKTLAFYEQTLKLFTLFLKQSFDIEDVKKVQSGHIRQYIKYLRERGKYTVVNKEESKNINHPDNRSDYKKDISTTTIAEYVRNIKVFSIICTTQSGKFQRTQWTVSTTLSLNGR